MGRSLSSPRRTRIRRVELTEGEEAPVPETGQDPALDHLHGNFDLRLVPGFSGPCRQDGGVVMLGERGEGRIERRLEPERLRDARLQVVADNALRHAAEEGECLTLPGDPVRQALGQARRGEGVGRGAEHGDEDLHLVDLAALGIDDPDRLAGIVGLHRRAGFVPVAPGRMRAALEGLEAVAEPGVAVAVGMCGPVFLPEQAQRHALALQLARHCRPVRLVRVARRAAHAPEQHLFQHRVVLAGRRQRPGRQTCLPGSQKIGRYRRPGELQPLRNLAHRQALRMAEPQDRPYILHRHSSRLLPSRHVPSRLKAER